MPPRFVKRGVSICLVVYSNLQTGICNHLKLYINCPAISVNPYKITNYKTKKRENFPPVHRLDGKMGKICFRRSDCRCMSDFFSSSTMHGKEETYFASSTRRSTRMYQTRNQGRDSVFIAQRHTISDSHTPGLPYRSPSRSVRR